MNYPSIRIEGPILSSDILERIEETPGQRPIDFNLDADTKVKDEIARAWADAQDYWRIFQRKLETLRVDSPATTETRQQWMAPLLGLLGFHLEYQPKGTELNGKTYNISHRAMNRAQAPVQIIGYREPAGLDRKPERSNLRMSAHAVVQEFLNLNEQLYGLVTNGRVLRLLRDSSRLVKLSYLEFDLDRIFTDSLFADFAVLYRLLHATRLPVTNDAAAESLLERYHQDSIEQGTRIREGLRAAVTEALEILGTGFVAHSENGELCDQIETGALEHTTFFSHLLRLVYRLLFLNVVEERGLIFPKGASAAQLRIYFDYYSLQRLRRLSHTRGLRTERHHDAWLSLLSTFELFERPEQASKLGVTAFNGQLFDPESLGPLGQCHLSNAALFHAIDRLCSFDDPKTNQRLPVNFGALATEEFGSVYEGLLELRPIIEIASQPSFSFQKAAGNDRKTSGSYYTPTSLVDSLLDSTLDPILDDHVRNHKALGYPNGEAAILSLTVCDPACGSGHFLIAAAQRIARRLALVRASDEEPSPDQLRHALRQVISRCIYAVDNNPMSVELCRVALWLEAVEPGKPLSFLDHHLRVGNSLFGATPKLIAAGLPDDAFTAIEGDDKKACALLKKRNKAERSGVGLLFAQQDAETQARLEQSAAALAQLPDDRPEDIRRKEAAFRQNEQTVEFRHKKQLADAWCAAFVVKKTFKPSHDPRYPSNEPIGITQSLLNNLSNHRVSGPDQPLINEAERLADSYRFFHWHLAFPEVFARGGFDIILGNPPWERFRILEKEWFATSAPTIADAQNAAVRKRMIDALATENPALHASFFDALRKADGESHFVRDSGRYPLCGRGDINSYAIFAELNRTLLSPRGRGGFIVPSGIATDDTTKFFFRDLIEHGSLASLYDFENRNGIFPGVHRSYKFCLLTLAGYAAATSVAQFVFFALQVDDLRDENRRFTLTAEDFARLNPNTHTCPIFRSKRDAEIAKSAYQRVPVLWREDDAGGNRWDLEFLRHFDLSTDSHHFRSAAELEAEGYKLEGNVFTSPFDRYLPLYEAKMFHQFDHRWCTYGEADETLDLTPQQKSNPVFVVQPRYWVREEIVESATPHYPKPVHLALALGETNSVHRLLNLWAAGDAANRGESSVAHRLFKSAPPFDEESQVAGSFGRLDEAWAADLACRFPLTAEDRARLDQSCDGLTDLARELVARFSPKWLMGWRDICRSTDERTLIAAALPRAAIGNSAPLLFSVSNDRLNLPLLLGNFGSFALDYMCRQKIGGIHINYHLLKQFPVLPPEFYRERQPWQRPDNNFGDWVRTRVLELTYTAHDLKAFAEDSRWDGPPFKWDETRRAVLRAELDAAYLHAYGLNRDDAAYVLSADNFPIVAAKRPDIFPAILAIYDAMAEATRTGIPFDSPVSPSSQKRMTR